MGGNKKPLEHKINKTRIKIFLLVLTLISLAAISVSYKKSLVDAENGTRTNQEIYVGSEEGLNMREKPSFYAESKNSLPYLSKLNVIDKEDGWIYVENNGQKGWVYAKYVTNSKPQEFSVRDLNFTEMIPTKDGFSTLLPPEFADFDKDGREDVLLTVETGGQINQRDFYIYSYQNGYILKKLLTINPTLKPELYENGYRGNTKLENKGDYLLLSYPKYNENDPLCCPSGGLIEKKFIWNHDIFKLM